MKIFIVIKVIVFFENNTFIFFTFVNGLYERYRWNGLRSGKKSKWFPSIYGGID